jgi:hypothetical protein
VNRNSTSQAGSPVHLWQASCTRGTVVVCDVISTTAGGNLFRSRPASRTTNNKCCCQLTCNAPASLLGPFLMSVFDVIDTTGDQVSWVAAEASASTSGAVRARLQMAKSSTAAAVQQP